MCVNTGGMNRGKARLARFIVPASAGYTKVDGSESQKPSPITFVAQQTISKTKYIVRLSTKYNIAP